MNTLSDPGNLSANGASALRKRVSDQVTNKNAVPEESQVRVLEMALPSPASSSDMRSARATKAICNSANGVLQIMGPSRSVVLIRLSSDYSVRIGTGRRQSPDSMRTHPSPIDRLNRYSHRRREHLHADAHATFCNLHHLKPAFSTMGSRTERSSKT
jgi:hypothetical protein